MHVIYDSDCANSDLVMMHALCVAGSALKCNHCVPQGGTRRTQTQETRGFGKDACIADSTSLPVIMGFRRCSSMAECLILQSNTAMKVKCCHSDICNNMVII
uniref:UPAR/Ly6 domain-containing protein n=1 Tax=Sinocyclocheilus grahami TaxID=75366 RepID=A0A672N8H0_SINGR